MIFIIKEGKLYYPDKVVNVYGQGTGSDTWRCFNNFHFFALQEAGNAPVIHYAMKAFRSPTMSTSTEQVGIYIDVMGMITCLSTNAKIHTPENNGHTEILHTPLLRNIDNPADGWTIVAANHRLYDMAAALMYKDSSKPHAVISKVMELDGVPGYRNIVSVPIDRVTKMIKESYVSGEEHLKDSQCVDHQFYLQSRLSGKK